MSNQGRIRIATPDDSTAIAAIYAPIVRDTPISFETQAPDAREFVRHIKRTLEQFAWLVWDEDGIARGYVYASAHRERAAYQWSADVTAYVDREFRGRGIGKALYQRLLALLRAQGYQNAYAGITLPNAPSVALHEGVGFQPIGVYRNVGYKMGRWHDVGWWHCSLGELMRDPQPPRPYPAIAG